MADTPQDGWPRITPALHYADARGAVGWLGRAFGFEPRTLEERPDGTLSHVELMFRDGLIMIWQLPDASPKALGGKNTMNLYIFVEDVDAHCARARAAGATLLAEPEDKPYGHRNYGAEDPEGHQWWFWSHPRG